MRTNEFGFLRFFAEIPVFSIGVLTKTTGDIKSASVNSEKENISKELKALTLSWGATLGVEYAISSTTKLIGGLGYQKYFLDLTEDSKVRGVQRTLSLLRRHAPFPEGGVMHCFSGDYNFAKRVLDLGLLISVPGIVTFKNSAVLQDVVQKIPLSSMVLETDGPFLAPHPFRGKRNEPLYILYTAQKVAEIKQTSLAEVARQTSQNSETLFKF